MKIVPLPTGLCEPDGTLTHAARTTVNKWLREFPPIHCCDSRTRHFSMVPKLHAVMEAVGAKEANGETTYCSMKLPGDFILPSLVTLAGLPGSTTHTRSFANR